MLKLFPKALRNLPLWEIKQGLALLQSILLYELLRLRKDTAVGFPSASEEQQGMWPLEKPEGPQCETEVVIKSA